MTTYSPTWTRNPLGAYNEQNAFVGMVGGTNSYVMEDEWNEAQWTLSAQRAKAFARTFSSGSFAKGSDSVANGTLTLAARDLLVAGHQIRMQGKAANSGNVLVALPTGPATGTRQDLVYLTMSLVEVNYQSTLYTYGYQGGDTLTNGLLDNRVSAETQRRIQKQWNLAVAQGQSTMTGAGFAATSYDSNLYTATNSAAVDGLTYAIPLYIVNRTAGSPDTLSDTAYYILNYAKAGQAGGYATLDPTGHLPASQLPTDVAKTDASNTFTQAQTFQNNVTIFNGAGSNGVAGIAPFFFMQNYSTNAGGQATFLSNWAGNNAWGIGGVDALNVQIGVANKTTGAWVAGQSFTLNIAGGLKTLNNTIDDGTGAASVKSLSINGQAVSAIQKPAYQHISFWAL